MFYTWWIGNSIWLFVFWTFLLAVSEVLLWSLAISCNNNMILLLSPLLSWPGQLARGAHRGGGGRRRWWGHGLRWQGGGVQGARWKGQCLPFTGGRAAQSGRSLSITLVRVGRDGLWPGAQDDLNTITQEEQENDNVCWRTGDTSEKHQVRAAATTLSFPILTCLHPFSSIPHLSYLLTHLFLTF